MRMNCEIHDSGDKKLMLEKKRELNRRRRLIDGGDLNWMSSMSLERNKTINQMEIYRTPIFAERLQC